MRDRGRDEMDNEDFVSLVMDVPPQNTFRIFQRSGLPESSEEGNCITNRV